VSRLNKPSRPIFCFVTDRSLFLAPPESRLSLLQGKIGAAISAGVDWIQIREKDLSAQDCAALAHAALHEVLRQRPDFPSAKILINDRLDIALTSGAAGVHLGEKSLAVEDARELADAFPAVSAKPFLIGASCHSVDAARATADSGADYLFFGPVFETPSKLRFGSPQGLARLGEVCRTVSVPVLAIGGIDLQNAASCLSAGASGIAAIRLFQDAADLPALVASLHALRFL
jgi:thiamine-phosphate pyrophosphorylase